jgi:hypothetical protein
VIHCISPRELAPSRIMDGIMEIDSIDLGRWVCGELYFWLPRAPQFAICNDEKLEVVAEGNSIYSIKVRFLGKGRIEIGL